MAQPDGGRPLEDALRGLSILVVDDDSAVLELLTAFLRMCGAEVHPTNAADEALEFLRHQRPDVVISDVALGAGDGYAVARAVRERPSAGSGQRILVLALSAHNNPTVRARAFDAGFDAYIAKPANLAGLVEAIARQARPHPDQR